MRRVQCIAAAAALAVAGALLTAAPANAACETQRFTRYCDGPIRYDGTWTRCQVSAGQGLPGLSNYIPSRSRCFSVDPRRPWPLYPPGQPHRYIGP